jgi:DNA-binding GntR family transcriptional regulator
MVDDVSNYPRPTELVRRRLMSDGVAVYVSELIARGHMRAGDRIDRDGIAESLGVSRSPVQEALIRLEMDGFVEMHYHRGAYVAPFDTPTIREHFDIYGLLAGMASANAAKQRTDEDLEQLASVLAQLGDDDDPLRQANMRGDFRTGVNRVGGGPRVRATMRSMNGLFGVLNSMAAPTPPVPPIDLLQKEFDAIRNRRPAAARACAIEVVDLVADEAIRQLTDRELLEAPKKARVGAGAATSGKSHDSR